MEEKAVLIVKKIMAQFQKREGPFSKRINIEDWVPTEWSSEKKARFLFYSSVLDYGMRSILLYKGVRTLFRQKPELLIPQTILSYEGNPEALTKTLVQYVHPRFPYEASKRWIVNSRIFLQRFKGEVLRIFKEERALQVLENIYLFRGFGKKTGHLFFRGVVNTLSFSYPDLEEVSMPIDRHKLRLTWEWGLITEEEYRKEDREKVAKIWKEACQKAGISWLQFDRAFWLLGQSKERLRI